MATTVKYFYRYPYLLLCSLWAITHIHAQNVKSNLDVQNELVSKIYDCLDNDNNSDALITALYLKDLDSLSTISMTTCLDCYMRLGKYEECIYQLNKWNQKYPEKNIKNLFQDSYGIAYYMQGKYNDSLPYLSAYIDSFDSAQMQPDLFCLGLYADVLHYSFDYQKAEKIYQRYFSLAGKKEGCSIEQLARKQRDYCYKFYNYAYNCCFLGDEIKGLKYLKLAQSGGDQRASYDLKILESGHTFANSLSLDKNTIKEFEKIIKQYDPKSNRGFNRFPNQSSFWMFVKNNSPETQKMMVALNRKNPPAALLSAKADIRSLERYVTDALKKCSPHSIGELEKTLVNILFGSHSPLKDFRTYLAPEVNAFATPYGQIYLTDALVGRYHDNRSLLAGVCAHEAAHFFCEHSVIQKWQDAEKGRKNTILSGVVAGLYVGTMAASGAITASGGGYVNQSYWDSLSDAMVKGGLIIDESFRKDAFYFKYKYSRSQEIESDIIGYRFCETFGIGGYAYIMALQLMEANAVYMQPSSTADHPTTKYRVSLLKYLYAKDHPIIVNEVTDTRTSLNIGYNLYRKKNPNRTNNLKYHGNPKCESALVSVNIIDVSSDGINDETLCNKCLSSEQINLIKKQTINANLY